MRLGLLGTLEVRDGRGQPLPVPGAKERLVLAALATAVPSAVSVDRLIDVLWGTTPPVTARKSLQAHVVRLRTALEPRRPPGSPGRYVAHLGAAYALVVTAEQVDTTWFAHLCARGRTELSGGDAAASRVTLAEALGLWRGTPYSDWPDAAFAEADRRRLESMWSNVVRWSLEAEIACGRHETAVPELERLLVDHPTQEDWWSLLAVALYRSGRQGDALAATRRARAVLADELGVDPGPGLRAVELAVLTQDARLDPPASASWAWTAPHGAGELTPGPQRNGFRAPPGRAPREGRPLDATAQRSNAANPRAEAIRPAR